MKLGEYHTRWWEPIVAYALVFVVLVLLFLILSAAGLAAPGDVLYQNYGNGTVTNDWTGTLQTYPDSPSIGPLRVAASAGCQNCGAKNVTGVNWQGKVVNMTFTLNERMQSYGTGQVFRFGMSGVTTDTWCGNGDFGVDINGANLGDTNWRWVRCDTGYETIQARSAGNHTFNIVINTSTNTSNTKIYVNGVNKLNSSTNIYGGIRSIWRYHGNNIAADQDIWNVTVCEEYCGSAAAPATAPSIDVQTYNLTTAIVNNTAWRTNTSFPIPTDDTTPTVTFNTSAAAYCRIHKQNQNWTTMGNLRNCTTTGNTAHTCTLAAADAVPSGIQDIYLGCIDSTQTAENTTSTSGPLRLSVSTCAYVSGDWKVNLGDQCNITTNVNVGSANRLYLNGTGRFTIRSGGNVSVGAVDFSPKTMNGQSVLSVLTGGKLDVVR